MRKKIAKPHRIDLFFRDSFETETILETASEQYARANFNKELIFRKVYLLKSQYVIKLYIDRQLVGEL